MSKRSYFQQRQRNRLYETVVRAVENAAASRGIKRKDIAERMGKSQQSLSRLLSGPANWEVDTVSDILFAIDAELTFEVVRFADKRRENELHADDEFSDTKNTSQGRSRGRASA